MSILYLAVLATIVSVLLGVSLLRTRGVKTKADFLVAGRSLPASILVFTLLSSWIGVGSLFAGAENAYRNGFASPWQPAVAGSVCSSSSSWRRERGSFAQFTIPDSLETRYCTAARVLGMIPILFAYTAIASYQFKGGGDILHLATGLNSTTGMYIIAGFVVVFTALAGMSSVAYLDLVIGLLVTATSLVAAPILLAKAGGFHGLKNLPPTTSRSWATSRSSRRAGSFFPPSCSCSGIRACTRSSFRRARREMRETRSWVGSWAPSSSRPSSSPLPSSAPRSSRAILSLPASRARPFHSWRATAFRRFWVRCSWARSSPR